MTSLEELEMLEEEEEEEEVTEGRMKQTGPVRIRRADDTVFEGQYEEGLPHGFFRHLNQFGDLEFFGCFLRGRLVGVCWKSLPGGGFLISRSWQFTHPGMVYLYPDCRTGLTGSFHQCNMVSAQLCELDNWVGLCSGCLPSPAMSPPTGPTYSTSHA